jgi:hypothetical protein
VASAVNVSLDVCPLVTVSGENEALRPGGRLATLSVIVVDPPSSEAVDTAIGMELPPTIVTTEGLTWREKLEGVTVSMMGA